MNNTKQTKEEISKTIDKILSLPKKQHRAKFEKTLKFVKNFAIQGRQAVTGLFKFKDCPDEKTIVSRSGKRINLNAIKGNQTKNNEPYVVFKISVQVDRTVEHEYDILNDLAQMEWCPHFVRAYRLLNTGVNSDYVLSVKEGSESYSYDSESESESESEDDFDIDSNSESEPEIDDKDLHPFMKTDESLHANILLMDYVHCSVDGHDFSLTLYDVIFEGERHHIWSTILSVLAALEMAQDHLNFTHYDLHTDNILFKQCEPDALFAYTVSEGTGDNYNFVVPTFGVYPVIIDCGNAYTKLVKTQRVSVNNYHNGLQPNWYDPLLDVHHFLLGLLNYVEYQSDEYYFITNRVMYLFRHINCLRKKGWKQLPNNVNKLVKRRIAELCPALNKLDTWYEYSSEVIEALMLGVKLPWASSFDVKDAKQWFPQCNTFEEFVNASFGVLCKNLRALEECDCLNYECDYIWILREFVETVHSTTRLDPKSVKKFKTAVESQLIDTRVPDTFNTKAMEAAVRTIQLVLPVLMNGYFEGNREVVEEWHSKTDVKKPMDVLKFIKQNVALRMPLTAQQPVYWWNSVDKVWSKTVLDNQDLEGKTTKEQEKAIFRKLKQKNN
jgi:hypothetical protein